MTRPHARFEPMLLLVIGLPAVSVVAGLGLVAVSMQSGASDSVRDDVRRVAQAQVLEMGPDQRTRAMGASALLSVGARGMDVFPVSGKLDRQQSLQLTLSHPMDESIDQRITLEPSSGGWHATPDLRAGHDWIVHLSPADGSWRLQGRLRTGESSAHLAPVLPSD